jgi:hypothetical protein
MCGVTARDFAVLAAARSKKQKGRGRGCLGLFIGAALGLIKAGSNEDLRGGVTVSGDVNARKKRSEVGDDVWAPPVSEREGRQRIPVRGLLVGLRVVSSAGPNRFPGSSYIFIFFFLFFFFCFLVSFINFA